MKKVEELSKDTLEFMKKTVEAIKCEKTDWSALKVMCVARQETNNKFLLEASDEEKESLKNQRLDLGICRVIIDIFYE
jgi:hypothetical protein